MIGRTNIQSTQEASIRLQESEERYRNLIELLPDALVVYADYQILYVNSSAVRMIGAAGAEDLIGEPVIRFLHPDYVDDLVRHVEQLIEEGKPSDLIQKKLVRMDGQPVDVEVRAVVVKYGGRTAIQLLIRDVTDRKKIEATLVETEKLYRNLLESTVAGVFLAHEDKMIYANPYLTSVLGYTQEQFLRLRPFEFLAEEESLSLRERIFFHRNANYKLNFSGRAVTKERRIVYLEGSFSRISYEGKPAILGTLHDVTFKKEREDELRETANMYQRLIKFIPEPIVLTDQGVLLYANNSALELLGARNEGDWMGKHICSFVHKDDHLASLQSLLDALGSDAPTPFVERRLVHMDGRTINVELSSIRIRNYMNKMVALTVIRDLTDRKRSEEMLVRSEKLSLVGQLAAGVGHEIRNPLTALKGFTQLLRSRNAEDLHYYNIMENELDRINMIVNEFMTLAKPHLAEFKEASPEQLVRSVFSLLDTHAIMLGVDIELRFGSDVPNIYCDENQIKQVLLNVIKNALEAISSGGYVLVSVRRLDELAIRITVEDNGVGIPEDVIGRIGEPFLTTKEKGTGLGLMVCNRIVEAHRGTLRLFSEKGKGTRVEITLPVM